MSGYMGIVIVLGVSVDADSDETADFVQELLRQDNSIPPIFFDHFDEYYDHFVLEKGSAPRYDIQTDYLDCFHEATVGGILNIDGIGCFRNACCLSEEWKNKIVVGKKLAHIRNVWLSPNGIDFTYPNDEMISSIKSHLSNHGFSTDVKTFALLDDCIICT